MSRNKTPSGEGMNADFRKDMADHMAFIKEVHVREMRTIEGAFSNPAPVICACCRRKMAEKHRAMPNKQAGLKLVHSRD